MSFNRVEIRLLLLLLLSSSLLLRFEAQQQFAASTSITASHVDPEHVHGGRREFQRGVKKTSSSHEDCVGEIENGKY